MRQFNLLSKHLERVERLVPLSTFQKYVKETFVFVVIFCDNPRPSGVLGRGEGGERGWAGCPGGVREGVGRGVI